MITEQWVVYLNATLRKAVSYVPAAGQTQVPVGGKLTIADTEGVILEVEPTIIDDIAVFVQQPLDLVGTRTSERAQFQLLLELSDGDVIPVSAGKAAVRPGIGSV